MIIPPHFYGGGWPLIINSTEVLRFQNKALLIKLVSLLCSTYEWMNEYDFCSYSTNSCVNLQKTQWRVLKQSGGKNKTLEPSSCCTALWGTVATLRTTAVVRVVRSLCTGLKTKKWKNRIYREMLSEEAREQYLEQTGLVGSVGDYAGVFTDDLLLFETSTCSDTADVDGWVERSLDYLWFSSVQTLPFCLRKRAHDLVTLHVGDLFILMCLSLNIDFECSYY